MESHRVWASSPVFPMSVGAQSPIKNRIKIAFFPVPGPSIKIIVYLLVVLPPFFVM